jgi:hypothetical protein
MNENEVAALVRGLAPGVRQCVAEAVAPFAARIAELEKGAPMLPSELAAEVANAARLLHELPPIVSRETPAGRVTRIERDESGALVPIYDGPQA